MASTDGDRFGVAIVGGGIVGLILAAGLIERGVYVRVYEQGRSLREIGAGIAFTKNVVRCMGQISPVVVEALRAAGSVNPSIDDGDPNAYFRWNDGYTKNEHDATYQERLYTLNAGPQGWETVRRDLFLTELQKRMPVDVVQLGMRVENVERPTSNGDKVLLIFADASTATFNAVIGCDGIKSKVRQILLGAEDPASHPQYTHKVAYRTLIPAAQALEALGEYRVQRLHFHVGPGAHLIHYPVNKDTIGAAVFITDPNDWPSDTSFTSRGPRTAVEIALANWSLPVTKLIRHFPAELDQWALFDMFEYPLSTYAYGQICLAGDAAHGPSPHHGAGAGMGVEDALCLAVLLEKIANRQSSGFAGAVTAAFTTFDAVRRTRTQWLVNSSRRVCDLYQHADWADKTRHTKAKTFFEEVKDRSLKIWNFDSDAMILEAVTKLSEKLESLEINTPTIVGDWIVQFGDLPGAQVSGEILRGEQLAYLQQKEQVVMLGHGVGTTIVMRSGSADEVWEVLKDAPYSKQGVWDLSAAVLTPMKAAIVKPL